MFCAVASSSLGIGRGHSVLWTERSKSILVCLEITPSLQHREAHADCY